MTQEIKELEELYRNSYLREQKTLNQEARTGIPREEILHEYIKIDRLLGYIANKIKGEQPPAQIKILKERKSFYNEMIKPYKEYKAIVESKREDYKRRLKAAQFVKPEPNMRKLNKLWTIN